MPGLVAAALESRRVWIAGMAGVSALTLALTAQTTYRHQASDFLPRRTGHPGDTEVMVRQRIGAADRLVVILESDDSLTPARAGPVLDSLAARLGRLRGVREVSYSVDSRLMGFLEKEGPDRLFLYLSPSQLREVSQRLAREGMERSLLDRERARPQPTSLAGTILERDPLGVILPVIKIAERASGNIRIRLSDGYYGLPGGRGFFMTIKPERRLQGVAEARSLVSGIEEVLWTIRSDPEFSSVMSDSRVYAVGRAVEYVTAFETARRDGRRVALVSGTAVFLLLAFFFRRLAAPLLLFTPVVVGLLVAGAAGFLLFRSVSLLAWVFVAVLVGLGVDFGLHILTAYWITGDARAGKVEALASAVTSPGPGIVIGGLTSAAAFAALAFISYPVMTQISVLMVLGLMSIMVASFVVLPILLSFGEPGSLGGSRWTNWADWWHRLAARSPRLGVVTWLVILSAAWWATPSIPLETHPWKIALEAIPQAATLERIRQTVGSSFSPVVMVSRGPTREQALARDREAVEDMDRIANIAGVARIESLSRWLPDPTRQRENIDYINSHRATFDPVRFESDFRRTVARMEQPDETLLTEYLPLVLRFLNPDPDTVSLTELSRVGGAELTRRHLLETDAGYLSLSYLFMRRLPWADGVIDRFEKAIERFGGEPLQDVEFIGDPLMATSHRALLRHDLLAAAIAAFVLVATILGVHFRRLRSTLLCLVPLACGVSCALGVMAVFHIELNLLTLTVVPLLLGIGVDDGVHVVTRLDRGQDAPTVLRELGPAMTMTTLTTMAAFASLGVASIGGIRQLGLVGAAGVTACLLASIHLVPILYRTRA